MGVKSKISKACSKTQILRMKIFGEVNQYQDFLTSFYLKFELKFGNIT